MIRSNINAWAALSSLLVATSCLTAFGDEKAELPDPVDREVDFVKEIQPLFKKHCIKCHRAEKQEAGFRLDSKDAAFAGGDSGVSIESGDSAESLLVRYIGGIDENITMPPEGDLLSKKEVAIIRGWIDQGADWPDAADTKVSQKRHWAYEPLAGEPPEVESPWMQNNIDAFVLAKLRGKKIAPNPTASRRVLIRRLYFDLLGLLPHPDEVEHFVADTSKDAYEKLVDRLLASKHFGERWGRHWLDLARYADSDGYEKDRPRPNAWRWRDWVIDAINNDQPFNEFTIEQIAGDLIRGASPMQRLATAFHRQTLTNTEGGTDQEQWRIEACFDRIATTATVWLGLTVGCARCHTHKYDQITQREYYQLFAFVNNGDETNTDVPKTSPTNDTFRRTLADHQLKLKAAEDKLASAKENLKPFVEDRIARLLAQIRDAEKSPPQWHVVEFDDVKIASKTKIKRLEDGSYLLNGRPDKDEYTLETSLEPANITAIRVETIPDNSLPGKGSGRASNGNFVLSHVRSYFAESGPLSNGALTFAKATADFNQNKFPPSLALDPKANNGWAVAPQMTKSHSITLHLAHPIENKDGRGRWQLVLDQQYGGAHTIGRFRVSVRSGGDPADRLSKSLLAAIKTDKAKRSSAQRAEILDYIAKTSDQTRDLVAQVATLRAATPKLPMMQVRVITERVNSPRTTFVFRRGEFLEPIRDTVIKPSGLGVLPELKLANEAKPNRMDLAKWLVSDENPLTPRVAVNHVWAHLFGEGIVRTLNDFGVRGEKPSHPQLLDWLAAQFKGPMAWSRKRLIKKIVMSATYRQASTHRPDLAELDPRNYLLARQNRLRAQAETIRDLCLSAGGLLSNKIGGPSVFPPLPPGVAELSYANNFKWATSQGEDRYRRGMYTFFKRTAPHPNLTTFDCPDANTTCVKRQSSNTPLQALILLNNEVYIDSARGFARRLLNNETRPGDSTRDQSLLNQAFLTVVARPMSRNESVEFSGLLEVSRAYYAEHPEDVKKITANAGGENVELAAWTATCRMLLNLDEFITRP